MKMRFYSEAGDRYADVVRRCTSMTEIDSYVLVASADYFFISFGIRSDADSTAGLLVLIWRISTAFSEQCGDFQGVFGCLEENFDYGTSTKTPCGVYCFYRCTLR
jgi:hypothetical protein